MFMELKRDDPRPAFRQIADEVQRSVAVGVLKPGDRVPAARELAAELKIDANTVRHGYRTLAAEGVVEVRRGRGTFVKAAGKEAGQRPALVARQIAEWALRECFRQGLLASDLMKALQEIAPTART